VRPWDGNALESVGGPRAGSVSEGLIQGTWGQSAGPALVVTAMVPSGKPSDLGLVYTFTRTPWLLPVPPLAIPQGVERRAWGMGLARTLIPGPMCLWVCPARASQAALASYGAQLTSQEVGGTGGHPR
jgi:hypothetical protein